MPLTTEQLAALDTAADALKGADAKDVDDALKAKLPEVRQVAFRVGYGTHKGESTTEINGLKEQITALEGERDTAKEEATRLAGTNTDFAAEKQRLEKLAADAKQEATDAKAAAETRIKALHAGRETAALQAKLVAAGVDPDYAEQVLVPKHAAKIRVDGLKDDGTATVSFLDDDGVPDSGGLDSLAGRIAKGVDARWITSNADSGSGRSGGQGGHGGGTYDPVKAGKEAAAAQKPTDNSNAFR